MGGRVRALSAAEREGRADPEDLRPLAVAAYLTGRDAESDGPWERAHHALPRAGDVPAAVRCAFWLVFELFNRGQMARAAGWLARAQRLLDDHRLDCVERGTCWSRWRRGRRRRGTPGGRTAHSVGPPSWAPVSVSRTW